MGATSKVGKAKLKAKYRFLENYKIVLKIELESCTNPNKKLELKNKIIGIEQFQHEINNKFQQGGFKYD